MNTTLPTTTVDVKKEFPYPSKTINLRKTKTGKGLTFGIFFKDLNKWANYYIDLAKLEAFFLNKEQIVYPCGKMNDLK